MRSPSTNICANKNLDYKFLLYLVLGICKPLCLLTNSTLAHHMFLWPSREKLWLSCIIISSYVALHFRVLSSVSIETSCNIEWIYFVCCNWFYEISWHIHFASNQPTSLASLYLARIQILNHQVQINLNYYFCSTTKHKSTNFELEGKLGSDFGEIWFFVCFVLFVFGISFCVRPFTLPAW